MKKRWLLIGLCLLLIIGLGVLYVGTRPVYTGGGESKDSPDGKFVAQANSRRNIAWFATDKRTFYEFEIWNAGDGGPDPIMRYVCRPRENSNEYYFRELPEIISWSPDSKTVSFTIPGMTLTLDTLEHPFP